MKEPDVLLGSFTTEEMFATATAQKGTRTSVLPVVDAT
jgi:hypothetical protein